MRSESQWRYRANQRGLRLVRYKQSSSAYGLYGPCALVDRASNKVLVMRLRPDDVEAALFGDIAGLTSACSEVN